MLLMRSYFVSVRVVCACDASRYGFSIRNIIIVRWSTHRLCVAKNEIDSLARILYQLKFIRFGILFIVFVSNFRFVLSSFIATIHTNSLYTRIFLYSHHFFSPSLLTRFCDMNTDTAYSLCTHSQRLKFVVSFLLSISWFSFLFLRDLFVDHENLYLKYVESHLFQFMFKK